MRPPGTGVPTPGATSGSSESRSSETWTKPGPCDPVERLAHRVLDPDPVDVAHREDADVRLAQERSLGGVERADADERDARGVERRECEPLVREPLRRLAERGRERHPVHVARRARLRRVEVAVRVDPDHAARLARGRRESGKRPDRDRMVAAEHEREGALPHRLLDERGELRARLEDLRQEPRPLVLERERLGLGRDDVAAVRHGEPDLREPLLEPGVADRRRAHVDAAARLAEVERRADDRDGTLHRAEPYTCGTGAASGPGRRYTSRPRRGSSVGRAHG